MTTQSTFDPSVFLNQQTTEANDVEFPTIPDGEYIAVSAPVTEKSIRTTPKGNVILDVLWYIEDDNVKATTGLQKPAVRQSLFLDLNEYGNLDMRRGRNIALGQLREAVGLNVPGKPFSFHMLGGQVAKITVRGRLADDGQVYNDVKKVTKAA